MREKQEQSREKLRTTLAKPAAADTVPGGNKTGVTLNMAGIRAIQQAKVRTSEVSKCCHAGWHRASLPLACLWYHQCGIIVTSA